MQRANQNVNATPCVSRIGSDEWNRYCLAVQNCGKEIRSNLGSKHVVSERPQRSLGSDPQLLHFFVVVLAIQDVPLLRALKDSPTLAFDFLSGSSVNFGFFGH